MSEFRWEDILPRTAGNREDHTLEKTVESARMRVIWDSVRRAMVLMGIGYACIAIQYGESWVNNSPLFRTVGAAVSLVSLLFCMFCGGVVWIINNSRDVIHWSIGMLPFGIQPFRSALGIVGVFTLLAIYMNRLPLIKRLSLAQLRILRHLIWVTVDVLWIFVIFQWVVHNLIFFQYLRDYALPGCLNGILSSLGSMI